MLISSPPACTHESVLVGIFDVPVINVNKTKFGGIITTLPPICKFVTVQKLNEDSETLKGAVKLAREIDPSAMQSKNGSLISAFLPLAAFAREGNIVGRGR